MQLQKHEQVEMKATMVQAWLLVTVFVICCPYFHFLKAVAHAAFFLLSSYRQKSANSRASAQEERKHVNLMLFSFCLPGVQTAKESL